MALTAKKVENVKPKESEFLLSDGRGLYLRVLPSGGKSWVYKYRRPADGKQAKLILGKVGKAWTLAKARREARKLRALLDEGKDPRAVKAAILQQNTSARNMQALFEAWMEHKGSSVSEATVKRYRYRWDRYLRKQLGNILTSDLSRAHLASCLDGMTRKGIKEETRKALSLLNLMLDYGVQRHYLDANPARLLKPKDFAASPGAPRDRALDLAELRALWLALEDAEQVKPGMASKTTQSPITGAAIRLLILTGARRGEATGMRWNELDLKAGTWEIPKTRTKNRRGHFVYLSPLALKILKDLQPLTGESRFVFESMDKPGQSIHQDSLTKALSRLQGVEEGPLTGIEPFTLHDLRRSAATGWGEYLKVPPHVIELMLNHLPKDKLVQTYQRASYAEEQRKAWKAWGTKIERFVANEPKNVVSITSKKTLKKRG